MQVDRFFASVASVSEWVFVQDHSYWNVFCWQIHFHTDQTHFHMRGFIQALAHYGLKNCSDVNRFIVLVGMGGERGRGGAFFTTTKKNATVLIQSGKKIRALPLFLLDFVMVREWMYSSIHFSFQATFLFYHPGNNFWWWWRWRV